MAVATFEADIDSFMVGVPTANNNDNYGSENYVTHQVRYDYGVKAAWTRGIVNFDVSSLSGEVINSAKLERYIYSINGGGEPCRLSRCTRPSDWVESEVTWNSYKSGGPWTTGGGDFDDTGPPAKIDYNEPSSTGWHTVTGLKDMVEDALDNRSGVLSLITRLVDEAPGDTQRYFWRSKDYGSSIWRLVVNYGVGGLPERGFLRGVGRGVMRGGL